jgi:hypothetical protein
LWYRERKRRAGARPGSGHGDRGRDARGRRRRGGDPAQASQPAERGTSERHEPGPAKALPRTLDAREGRPGSGTYRLGEIIPSI